MSSVTRIGPVHRADTQAEIDKDCDQVIAIWGIAAIADLIYMAIENDIADSLDENTIVNAAGALRDIARGVLGGAS